MHKLTRITAAVLLSLSMASTGMLTAYADETTAAPASPGYTAPEVPAPDAASDPAQAPETQPQEQAAQTPTDAQLPQAPTDTAVLPADTLPQTQAAQSSAYPFLIPMRKRLSELLSRRLKTVKPYLILQAAYARLISTGHLPLLPMTPCITMETAGTPCR